MSSQAYLSYYGEQGITAVRQNTRNLALHYERRRSLYRLLGLEARDFRNARVLEFGPGTGDNALYVASCAPQEYVLVDGNPASIDAISDKLCRGLLPSDRVECVESNILDYREPRPFHIVLCEGVVPMQADPEAFLAHVASFVGPEGVLVLTAVSPASVLAEVCRRVLKPVLARRVRDPRRLLEELVRFFEPDLRSLPGMSRLHEDWVLDNILHPWAERFTFTIPEIVRTLDRDFDVRGCSPGFVQDWRWYKSIPEDERSWNALVLEEYDRWAGYMLDYRVQPAMPGLWSAGELDAACLDAIRIHHDIWHGDRLDRVPELARQLERIGDMVAPQMPATARSIADYLTGLRGLMGGHEADFATFRCWFGRGQQYVSLIRRADG